MSQATLKYFIFSIRVQIQENVKFMTYSESNYNGGNFTV